MISPKDNEEEEIKKILNDEKVKEALNETESAREVTPSKNKDNSFIFLYALIVIVVSALLYYLLEGRF